MADSCYSGPRTTLPQPLVRTLASNPRRNIFCHSSTAISLGASPGQYAGQEIEQDAFESSEELLKAYRELQHQNKGLLVMTAKMSREMQVLREETQNVTDKMKEVAREVVREAISQTKDSQAVKDSRSKKLPPDLTVSFFWV